MVTRCTDIFAHCLNAATNGVDDSSYITIGAGAGAGAADFVAGGGGGVEGDGSVGKQ